MGNVVLIDRGDHWEVIGDYSRSPRIAALSEAEWASYFDGPEFQSMKETQVGSIATSAPQGIGKWLKDWSARYTPPLLAISSKAAPDFDNVPAVNSGGAEVHQVTVQGSPAMDGVSLRILSSAPIPVSENEISLMDGVANLEVGPCPYPCDMVITVVDPAGELNKKALLLRFK